MKYVLFIVILSSTGCSLLKSYNTRSYRYQKCIWDAIDKGVSQSRLKIICDTAIDGEVK